MAASGLHISLSAEPIADIGGFLLTNSQFTSLIVSGGLILFALIVRLSLKQTNKPTGIQNLAEWIVESLHGLIYPITSNEKRTAHFFPLVSTFFLFILLNNWIGLLPGVGPIMVPVAHSTTEESSSERAQNRPWGLVPVAQAVSPTVQPHATPTTTLPAQSGEPVNATQVEPTAEHPAEAEPHEAKTPLFRPGTADLNTTFALSIISVVMIQVYGVSYLGLSYFKKFINFSSPIMFFVGVLEMISEVVKIISFAFRLFGNIFAGEVLLIVIGSLMAIVAPMPFYGLEIFVGFIQALVFSMLSIVFFDMATHSHDEH